MLIIVAIALGVILNPLNTTMITVALPAIQPDFNLSSTDISWLIASYFIISAICTPLIGRISDMYGRKNLFLFGMGTVVISSLLAPHSTSMLMLLGMRGIQAVGTSALYPTGIGIVRTYIKKNQHRVIGTLSVFATTSAAFGPTISGLLIQFGGWPVIFYVNLPILLIGGLLAFMFIPKDDRSNQKTNKWDLLGILLFSLTITFWMVFLLSLEDGFNLGSFIVAIIVSGLFYLQEKRHTDPFININFFQKNIHITLIYGQYILTTVIFFALLLAMPSFLQQVLSVSSSTTGIIMLALSVFAMVTTPIATRWTEKSGFRIPLIVGAIIGIVAALLLLSVTDQSTIVWIGIVLASFGITNGIQNISLQNLLYSRIAVSESGIAAGLLMTSRFIGNILASSIFGIMFATGINHHNLNSMSILLLIISVILVPGMLFVTRGKGK